MIDPNQVQPNQQEADETEIRDAGKAFLKTLDRFPPSRCISLAKTKVEEAVLWGIQSTKE